jgi:hypothetical protein
VRIVCSFWRTVGERSGYPNRERGETDPDAIAALVSVTRMRRLLSAIFGGPAPAVEVPGGIDQTDVRKGLRKVAEQPAGARLALFGQQADVVAQREQPLKNAVRP